MPSEIDTYETYEMIKFIFALITVFACSANAATLAEEVPLDSINNKLLFDQWKARFEPLFRKRIDDATPGAIASITVANMELTHFRGQVLV